MRDRVRERENGQSAGNEGEVKILSSMSLREMGVRVAGTMPALQMAFLRICASWPDAGAATAAGAARAARAARAFYLLIFVLRCNRRPRYVCT